MRINSFDKKNESTQTTFVCDDLIMGTNVPSGPNMASILTATLQSNAICKTKDKNRI